MNALYRKTGVSTRYYASDEETALDLSIKACEELFKNRPEIKDGIINLPNAPGFGWDLNEDFISKYRI